MNISEIVSSQRAFFETGATVSYEARVNSLDILIDAIKKYEGEICEALQKDLGKSQFESVMTETAMVSGEAEFLRRHLKKWIKPKRAKTPIAQFYGKSFTSAMPYGTVLIMSPWNYPFQLCIEPLLGAIAAGNCAVLKPSNYAPNTAKLIEKIISQSFPQNYICVVTGGRAENAELLEQHFDKIFFTGGKAVGTLVLEKAAKNLTPVTLELGGKSPCIVCADADIKIAARRIAFGKFLNAGQTCVAPDYILAQKDIAEKLAAEIKLNINKFFGENPLTYKDYPKIISEKHFNRLCGLINGEKVFWGGNFSKTTNKIEPTVLLNIACNAPIMQEEIFGPILPIVLFENISEIPQIVRRHETPLALYLFTKSRQTENFVLNNIQFGGGCINDTIIHLATQNMPFGGVGKSGMGSYHGKSSFDCFSHSRSICKKSTAIDLPLRYHPYSAKKLKIVRMFMK